MTNNPLAGIHELRAAVRWAGNVPEYQHDNLTAAGILKRYRVVVEARGQEGPYGNFCPHCTAEAGDPCVDARGVVRLRPHMRRRIEIATR